MTMMLIDAGRSSRGWGRIGNFAKCPQLFAYLYRSEGLADDNGVAPDIAPPAEALAKGSIGHTLQAHLHAIWGAAQPQGVVVDETHYTDPSVFMEPEDAAKAWCDKYGSHNLLPQMIKVFHAYLTRFPEPPGDVIAVEAAVTAVLGTLRGNWGLWVGEEAGGEWRSLDGAVIEVTPLHAPDHKEHGRPITLTRRFDLVTRDKSGRYYIWDHKHQASVNAKNSASAYAIDGGFAAFRIMGRQLYGEAFGGLTLNLISSTQIGVVAREQVPTTPHRDAHFAKWLWWAEHQIASLDLTTDPWEWPKAQNELSCYGRYGACAGLDLCSLGRHA
jgi:hypothetical protein